MEIVSALIDMSLGVSEGRIAVGTPDVCIAVGGRELSVGGGMVGVAKTLTEKLQASSTSALNRKTSINRNHLPCFIAFSFRRGSLEFPIGNDYKTFSLGFLFLGRSRSGSFNWHNLSPSFRPVPKISGIISLYPRIDGFRTPVLLSGWRFSFFHHNEWRYT
jgi:hypothetical protein